MAVAEDGELVERVYLAYGSNMSSRRLGERVGPVHVLGSARIDDFRIAFNKPGRDGTGKANLVHEPGARAWGVAWSVTSQALEILDRYEGGYERVVRSIRVEGAGLVEAAVYLWTRRTPEITPTSGYLGHLIEGAREHALPDAWQEHLRRVVTVLDDR